MPEVILNSVKRMEKCFGKPINVGFCGQGSRRL